MANLAGMTLGPYRIIERIGRGGMATVYKAYHAAMDRHVAIKVLPEEFADDPDFRARFEREAKTVAKLQHTNILPVFDYGHEQDISYLVMPYISTGTLKDYMKQGPLDLKEAGRIFRQLALALDYAHVQGIIHRDLKPDNVLFDDSNNALLTDFGLTRMVESNSNLTGTGVIGTPAYMSPEQGQGLPLDTRSDIYSMGIILYEMVTGQVPFSADTPIAVIFKHINDPLPLPHILRPDLPEDAENVILKALSKELDQRYKTCVAMADAFIRATTVQQNDVGTASQVGDPTFIPVPSPDTDTVLLPHETSKRSRWKWAASGIVILGIVGGAIALGILSPERAEDPNQVIVAAVTDTRTLSSSPTEVLTSTPSSSLSPTDTLTNTPTATATPTITPTPTVTLTPSFTPTPTSTVTNTLTATPVIPLVEARRDLPVRLGPGAQYPEAMTLEAGETLDILGQSEDGRWYQVLMPDGLLGWIPAAFSLVNTSGNVAELEIAVSPTPTATKTPTPTPTMTPSSTPTPTATSTNTATPTVTSSNTPTSTNTNTPTITPSYTPTATHTATNTPTITPSHTSAPTPSSTLTQIPVSASYPGGGRVTANSQWTPVIQDFGGVEMVLVPAGCFMMGGGTGRDNESPVHEQCFDEPFWIDRTEVTNAQYGSTGEFRGDNYPREGVNYFEAKSFCESRGGRLPTEAEWEYAARGPDNLIYPWGNEFLRDNLIWKDGNTTRTSPVGSIPTGASWVEALDMSGNVWEWTSSIFWEYPYNPLDGRENHADTSSSRSIRGGSWDYGNADVSQASFRAGLGYELSSHDDGIGFRCVRDYAGARMLDSQIIYQDDFSSNIVGWEETNEGSLRSEIIEGVYRITFAPSSDQTYWIVAPGFTDYSLAPNLDGPYELQFDVHSVFSSSDNYSIVILFDVGPGYLPHKRLYLRGDGTWQLVRWSGQRELISQGELSGGAIDFQNGAVHQVVLRVETDQYNILVDNQLRATIPAVDPIQGTVGFGLDGGDDENSMLYAEFDNLTIYDLGTITTPLLTTVPTATTAPTNTLTFTPTPALDVGIISANQTVNVRGGPGTEYSIRGQLDPDDQVDIIELSGSWLSIRLPDGQIGWIHTDLIQIIGTATPMPTSTVTATPDLRLADILQRAAAGVVSNDEWEPFNWTFDDNVPVVLIPAGSFRMGSAIAQIEAAFEMCQENAEDDAPCQRTWFDPESPPSSQTFSNPFWIDRTEVTRAQYQQCVNVGECSSTPDSSYSTEPDQPVNRVTWFQAQAYCSWRGGRLPTEAEWEYAARGPDGLIYPWGNQFVPDNVIHVDTPEIGDTQAASVGTRLAGASWVGALDMSGNVWEWTSSLYETYPYDATDGRERDTGRSTSILRVLRGGSFFDGPSLLRTVYRGWLVPDSMLGPIGFRCVRDVGEIVAIPIAPASTNIEPDNETINYADFECPGAYGPNFRIGDRFIVPFGDRPSRVWSSPNSAPLVGEVAEGSGGVIVDGPICKEGQQGNIVTWQVFTDNGLKGWMAEGYPHSDPVWIEPESNARG